MYFVLGTVLPIYWSCHLQSNQCNWKNTGSNEPSCFLFFVCLCIMFVCAEKSILFPQPKKHLLWIVYWVPYKSVAAVTEVTIKVTPWGSLFIFFFSLSWRPSSAHFLSLATSAAVSSCQQENQSFVNTTGQLHDVIGKLRAGALWNPHIPFASPLWTMTEAGFLWAPTGLPSYVCFWIFFFFTCAENVIGEADSNPSFLCKDRQDENSIQTSNGKQKINFEQIQDSCMWEGPNVQIRACATILNQTSVSKKYGSVLACLLCSVSNVFVCLCVFLCVLAEGMRGISSEQGGHTELFILHCPKGCKWL